MLQLAYKPNLKQIGQKMAFLVSSPAWDQPTDIQNRQISMQILTQHARVGLQTKFEANRTKNGNFGLRTRRPAEANPQRPARQANFA